MQQSPYKLFSISHENFCDCITQERLAWYYGDDCCIYEVKKLRQAEPCGAPVCMMSLVEPGEGPVQVHHYCLSVLDLLSESGGVLRAAGLRSFAYVWFRALLEHMSARRMVAKENICELAFQFCLTP